MKPIAIVYTSAAGHTAQYARMLGDLTGMPVFASQEAGKQLPAGTPIVYLGWLQASHVKGYAAAAKRFSVQAVCGVGLCENGSLITQVRKTSGLPAGLPLFTLQGGIDKSKLTGVNKRIISLLTKGLADQKQRSPQDERILQLLQTDANYVCEENLSPVLTWFQTVEPETQ